MAPIWRAVASYLFGSQAAISSGPRLWTSNNADPDENVSPSPSRVQGLRHGGVASESDICSRIGIDILSDGGNAADALVGTVFCVGVIGMYHSGIGGGGFTLVREPSGKHIVLDFRETAPAAAYEEMYHDNVQGSITSGLASGVPGEVAGLWELHSRYGTLPWERLVRPAAKIATDGWTVNEDLIAYMDVAAGTNRSEGFLVTDPQWAVDFAPNGTRLGLGETITRKRYGRTLNKIAKYGPKAFYEGEDAEAMIRALQAANGTMTMDDLKDYRVIVREPLEATYRGYTMRGCPAPASGAVSMSVLKIVEGFEDMGSPGSTNISTHRLDEAMRWGYAQRSQLGDPEYFENITTIERGMIDARNAVDIRTKILDYSQNVSYYNPRGLEILETHGTSHIVAADEDGMAITLTTTVNLLFGSLLVVPETGVIMNNEMNDFSIPGKSNEFGFVPSPINFIRPGKRPLSSLTPTIVERPDGSLYFVTGAAGGSRIITATILSLWNVLDRGMTALEALQEPRFHDQLQPDTAQFEPDFDPSTIAFMASRDHNTTYLHLRSSAIQALRVLPNGEFEAASEPRQKNSGGFTI